MRVAALLGLVILGCVPRGTAFPDSVTTRGYDVDARFTDPEIRAIRDGVEAWEEACKDRLVFVETVPRIADLHFRRANLGELGTDPRIGFVVGKWHPPTGMIPVVPTERLRAIVIHETGHVLGLGHDESPASFMHESIETVVHPEGPIDLEDSRRACP